MVPWGSYGISRSRCHSAADVLEQQQPALLVCAAAAVSRAAAAQSRGSFEGSGTSAASGTLGPTSRSLQDEAARWFGDDS